MLIAAGADIRGRTATLKTPLHAAALSWSATTIRALLCEPCAGGCTCRAPCARQPDGLACTAQHKQGGSPVLTHKTSGGALCMLQLRGRRSTPGASTAPSRCTPPLGPGSRARCRSSSMRGQRSGGVLMFFLMNVRTSPHAWQTSQPRAHFACMANRLHSFAVHLTY